VHEADGAVPLAYEPPQDQSGACSSEAAAAASVDARDTYRR
jgi:hypothetical protein